jgi:hypothetical protein
MCVCDYSSVGMLVGPNVKVYRIFRSQVRFLPAPSGSVAQLAEQKTLTLTATCLTSILTEE